MQKPKKIKFFCREASPAPFFLGFVPFMDLFLYYLFTWIQDNLKFKMVP